MINLPNLMFNMISLLLGLAFFILLFYVFINRINQEDDFEDRDN